MQAIKYHKRGIAVDIKPKTFDLNTRTLNTSSIVLGIQEKDNRGTIIFSRYRSLADCFGLQILNFNIILFVLERGQNG